jgi:hypothetical protein
MAIPQCFALSSRTLRSLETHGDTKRTTFWLVRWSCSRDLAYTGQATRQLIQNGRCPWKCTRTYVGFNLFLTPPDFSVPLHASDIFQLIRYLNYTSNPPTTFLRYQTNSFGSRIVSENRPLGYEFYACFLCILKSDEVVGPNFHLHYAGLKVGAYLVANATKIFSLLLKYVF